MRGLAQTLVIDAGPLTVHVSPALDASGEADPLWRSVVIRDRQHRPIGVNSKVPVFVLEELQSECGQ